MALDPIKISTLTELTDLAADDESLINDISEVLDINKTKRIKASTILQKAALVPEVQTDTVRTFGLSDAGKLIALTGSTDRVFTVPANATVPFPIGTVIAIVKDGTGNITLAEADGVNIKTEVGLILSDQYGMATLVKVDTNVWRAGGSLSA